MPKKLCLLLLCWSFWTTSYAQNSPDHFDLSGQPATVSPDQDLGITKTVPPFLHIVRTPLTPSHGVVLLLPGGGYKNLAMKSEGQNVAKVLNDHGYDVAILAYTVGQGMDIPLVDAEKAVHLLQAHGKGWGINNTSLSVMGFSAGGHLASHLVHALGEEQPFHHLIMIYPACLNSNKDGTCIVAPDLMPPSPLSAHVFVMFGDKDTAGWISGGQAYVDAVLKAGGSAEFHLLPDIKHGFAIPDPKAPLPCWNLLFDFLKKHP